MAMMINDDPKEYLSYHKLDPFDIKAYFTQPTLMILANEAELVKCGRIIGRKMENSQHIFHGDTAREIIMNWNAY